MFQSERFFREAWPTISQAVESPADAARAVQWILGRTRLAPGSSVLDAPCGFETRSVPRTSGWLARWWLLPSEAADTASGTLVGETEIRLYAAHELRAMLRPERWSQVDVYGALDGTPFSLDTPRLVFVARK